jgi:RNA recognition motif-containing protein
MMVIEITNLHLDAKETDLRRLFTPFGEISSVEIVRDRLNNRSKGKAMIYMPLQKQAQQAAVTLNGSKVSGKSIIVTLLPSVNEEGKIGIL